MGKLARLAAVTAAAALAACGPAAAAAPAGPPFLGTLNEAIRWYRQQRAEAAIASDPSDVVYADAVRRQARAILQLTFEWARGQAALEPGAGAQAATGGSIDAPALARHAAEAAQAAERAQAKVTALERAVASARGARAALLRRQVAEARSELALARARRDTLRTFADFVVSQGGAGAGGVLGQIAELERSVPELSAPAPGAASAGAGGSGTLRRAAPSGVVSLVSELLGVGRKLGALHDGATLTAQLRADLDKLRAPLVAELRGTLQQADALSGAPATADPPALDARTRQISALVDRFKAVSGALVPLGKADVLLRAQEATLAEWRGAVQAQYGTVLRALALRLVVLAAALAALLVASAFWRTATYRYVKDTRRRQQSLLVRRFVVGALVALVLLFSFVTELGSVATFAGFITAGLAVALQNVILSVVAYFFLIGKYGVRVGDRLQISGVTGDVVDVGLVRLHLLEVGADGLRTGRVVVFSNAVLFQPTANFFKQIPGSDFAWHQLTLTLSPDTDYRYAESRIVGAVERIYQEYEARMAQQHDRMSQDLAVRMEQPRPHAHLRLTESGLEMTIRFPVPLERAAELDDRMSRAVVEAIGREPRLKLAGSGTPTIQAVPGAPAPA